MRGKDLLDKMELIDPAYIEAAEISPKVKKSVRVKKYIVFAACFLLLLSVTVVTYAVTVDIREYNEAVRFFNDSDISTEGLTRREIKKIYRDIITNSGSYDKLNNGDSGNISLDSVEGNEIDQEEPTPEDIKENNGEFSNTDPIGFYYKYSSEYGEKDSGGIDFDDFKGSCIEKYFGGALVWKTSFTDFSVSGYNVVSDGVIVYGNTNKALSTPDRLCMAKLDTDGNIIWQKPVDSSLENEDITDVVENADGSYAVISRGDFYYLCIRQYTPDGKQTYFNKTYVGKWTPWKAIRFEDGYVVQIGNYGEDEHARIIKVDRDGNITDSFSYAEDDIVYFINDMTEYDGKLYLSVHTVTKDFYALARFVQNNDLSNISNEDLTHLIRSKYNAMLLIIDCDSGEPETFYSVKGSLGGELSTNSKGELLWKVESISTTFYSPATSSFTFGGTSHVFRYTFNGSGELIGRTKTGEITDYRR